MTEDPTQQPDPSSPWVVEPNVGARKRSLAAVYVLGLVTAGIYLIIWTFRTLEETRPKTSISPLALAIGSVIFPVRAALLYEIHRRSLERRSLDASFRSYGTASLLTLAIGIFLMFRPWGESWALEWILSPIPFLLVQASINREAGAVRPKRRALQYVGVFASASIGAAAVGAIVWFVDLPMARVAFRPTIDVGDTVAGSSNLYSLHVTEPVWKRVDSGFLGDIGSDLEMLSRDGESWVIVYVSSIWEGSLHQTVENRRTMILADEVLEDFEEDRFFAEESDLALVSIARYDVGSPPILRARYVVYTGQTEEFVIEIVGYSNGSADERRGIESLIRSTRLADAEVAK